MFTENESFIIQGGNPDRDFPVPNIIEETFDGEYRPRFTEMPEDSTMSEGDLVLNLKPSKVKGNDSGTTVYVSFPLGVTDYHFYDSFKEDMRNILEGRTNGSTYIKTSGTGYFGIQGARDLNAVFNQIEMAITSFKSRLPDGSKAGEFSELLNDVQLSVSKNPLDREVLFTFDRTESAKEIISQSVVRGENSNLLIYGGLALALLILFK